jgi:hypothetical protein
LFGDWLCIVPLDEIVYVVWVLPYVWALAMIVFEKSVGASKRVISAIMIVLFFIVALPDT